eukprot:9065141-Ditylum_brightwellii.AAC.1
MPMPLMPPIVVTERLRGLMPGYSGEGCAGSQWTADGDVARAMYPTILCVHLTLMSLHLLCSQSFEWEMQSKKWSPKMSTISFYIDIRIVVKKLGSSSICIWQCGSVRVGDGVGAPIIVPR